MNCCVRLVDRVHSALKHLRRLSYGSLLGVGVLFNSCALEDDPQPNQGIVGKIVFTDYSKMMCGSDSLYSVFVTGQGESKKELSSDSDTSSKNYTPELLLSPHGLFVSYQSISSSNCSRKHVIVDLSGKKIFSSESASSGGEHAWSPDGRYFAFSIYKDGIFLYDTLDEKVTTLINSYAGHYDHSPAWSPDSSKIAYANHTFGNSASIRVIDANGSNLVPVADVMTAFDADVHPQWLNTNSFVFTDTNRIYLADGSGGTYQSSVVVDDTNIRSLNLSPKKTLLLYTIRDPFTGNYYIKMANPKNWKTVTVVPDEDIDFESVTDVAWSPLGDSFVFTTETKLSLYTLNNFFIHTILHFNDTDSGRSVDWGL